MFGSVLDGPEVLKRAHDARMKKRLLRWGLIAYYALFWLSLLVIFLLNRSPGVKTKWPLSDIMFIFMALLGPWVGSFIGIEAMSNDIIRFTYDLPIEAGSANAMVCRLRSALEAVSIATGKPQLGCRTMDSSMPDALAAIVEGRPHLLVTSGLLESDLSERELTAMVAHEAAHIATGEALSWFRSSLSFLLAMNFTLLTIPLIVLVNLLVNKRGLEVLSPAVTILLMVFAGIPPILVLYINDLASRQDDFFADALAVQVTRDPEALVSCIKKVAASPGTILYRSFWGMKQGAPAINVKATIPRYTSRYFFVNPFCRETGLPEEMEPNRFGHPVDAYQDGLFAKGVAALTRKQLPRYHREQMLFLYDRLMALEHIRRGNVETAHHAGSLPPGEWE